MVCKNNIKLVMRLILKKVRKMLAITKLSLAIL